jgi:N-acetylmuramoyl-L-alanine amidase
MSIRTIRTARWSFVLGARFRLGAEMPRCAARHAAVLCLAALSGFLSPAAPVAAAGTGSQIESRPPDAKAPQTKAPETKAPETDGTVTGSPTAERYPVASEIRLGGDETRTRLIADLSEKIEIRAFALANPYRVVIDMPQLVFQFPAKTGETGRGLVKAFRYGLVMQGGSRLVLDLARPARIEKAFVLDAAQGQPARLVLDLVAVDRDAFMRALSLDNRIPGGGESKAEGHAEAAKAAGDPRPLIVIDPGHGGIDNGTRSSPTGQPEKTLVLDFGIALRDKIEKTGKFRVAMTRSDDTFVALAERVNLARARHAALFISIHADALPRREGATRGATIYTLSETASDAAAARLAEDENRADVIAGLDLTDEPSDVADILIDLARRETKTFSVQFARALVGDMRKATTLHKEPLKSASFRVLKAPDIPSVLIELGYVTNRDDWKALNSDTWRTRTADAILQSIQTFFATRVVGAGRNAGQN